LRGRAAQAQRSALLLSYREQMMKLVAAFILAAAIFPALTFVQSTTDVCYVSTHSWRRPNGLGSGNFLLGKFRLAAFDQQTIKSFRDYQMLKGTLSFTVGVTMVERAGLGYLGATREKHAWHV